MLIYDQFGIIQNFQTSPIPQTSFLPWTFLAISYSKVALRCNPAIMNGSLLAHVMF